MKDTTMRYALEVYREDEMVFHSDGKWLYPLFELERALETAPYQAAELVVRDKIVGRAAALLLVRLGVREIQAGLISKPAIEALECHNLSYTYRRLVPKINCQTEALLADIYDPEIAHQILIARAAADC